MCIACNERPFFNHHGTSFSARLNTYSSFTQGESSHCFFLCRVIPLYLHFFHPLPPSCVIEPFTSRKSCRIAHQISFHSSPFHKRKSIGRRLSRLEDSFFSPQRFLCWALTLFLVPRNPCLHSDLPLLPLPTSLTRWTDRP